MDKNVTPNLQHSLSWHQHIYSSVTNGCRYESMLLKTRLVSCQVVSGEVLAGTQIPGRWGRGRLCRVVSGEVLAGTDMPGRWERVRLWRVVSGEVLAGTVIPGRWGNGASLWHHALTTRMTPALTPSLPRCYLKGFSSKGTQLKVDC